MQNYQSTAPVSILKKQYFFIPEFRYFFILEILIKLTVFITKTTYLPDLMIMKKLASVIFILLSLVLPSQQIFPLNEKPYLDSLQKMVKNSTDRDSKANAFFILSNYYRNTDSILSKRYLENGKTLRSANSFVSAKYHYYEGQYYLEKDKTKAAAAYQQAIQALSTFKTEESYFFQSLAWYNYGVSQKNKEGYPFLVKTILEKSIPLVEKYETNRNLGFLYSQLALILTYNAEFEKAGNYNKKH